MYIRDAFDREGVRIDQGATIREIQEKSGARIDIEKGEDNDVIKVSGSSAAVSKAVKIINQIVNPVYVHAISYLL